MRQFLEAHPTGEVFLAPWDEGAYSRPTELTRASGDVLVSTVIAGFELPHVEVFRIPV